MCELSPSDDWITWPKKTIFLYKLFNMTCFHFFYLISLHGVYLFHVLRLQVYVSFNFCSHQGKVEQAGYPKAVSVCLVRAPISSVLRHTSEAHDVIVIYCQSRNWTLKTFMYIFHAVQWWIDPFDTLDIHLYRNVQLLQIFSLNMHCVYQTLTLDNSII